MGCNAFLERLYLFPWELYHQCHRSVDAIVWCKRALKWMFISRSSTHNLGRQQNRRWLKFVVDKKCGSDEIVVMQVISNWKHVDKQGLDAISANQPVRVYSRRYVLPVMTS